MMEMFKVKSGSGGFTLIEVMVVVGIIGILAAVAAPAYFNHVMRSRQTDAIYELMAINASQERYFAEAGTYAATFGDLDVYKSAGAGDYTGKYFTYNLAGGMITATADLDGDPATETIWQVKVGDINDKPTQLSSSNEKFGWSSLAAVLAD
ncbi:MAG: type IV pilin protein [Desulfurivibrionaceae bacterium]